MPVPRYWRDQPPKEGLVDHVIGAAEDRRRHREAKRVGSLHVDHQVELGWLLDWEIHRPDKRLRHPEPWLCGWALAWTKAVVTPLGLMLKPRCGKSLLAFFHTRRQAVAPVRVAGSFSQASATLNTSANPKARVARVSRWT